MRIHSCARTRILGYNCSPFVSFLLNLPLYWDLNSDFYLALLESLVTYFSQSWYVNDILLNPCIYINIFLYLWFEIISWLGIGLLNCKFLLSEYEDITSIASTFKFYNEIFYFFYQYIFFYRSLYKFFFVSKIQEYSLNRSNMAETQSSS